VIVVGASRSNPNRGAPIGSENIRAFGYEPNARPSLDARILALQPLAAIPQPGNPNVVLRIFMTAFVDSGHLPQKNFPFSNFRTTECEPSDLSFLFDFEREGPVLWARLVPVPTLFR